jgi:hypothetical protein
MVINDLDVGRAIVCPHEANSPLAIDPNALLPGTIADHPFK